MKHEALATTAQVLTITSQILLIAIEGGMIAGGYYFYKKVIKDEKPAEVVAVPDGMQLVPVEQPEKKSWKEKWQKVRKIAQAVIDG